MTRTATAALATLTVCALVGLTGCGGDPAQPAGPAAAAPRADDRPSATSSAPPPSPNSFLPYPVQTVAPGPSATTAKPRGDAPDPASIDRHRAVAVGQAFVELAYTNDTALDTTPADAGRRAAALAGDPLAEDLRTARSVAAPGATWQNWVQHHAYTQVTTDENVDDGRPADTAASVVRSWTVTATPTGDDGWTGSAQKITAYVSLTNDRPDGTGTWAVTDLRSAA